VPENGIPLLAAQIAGRSLDDFFARFVDGTEDPPLAEMLAHVGVSLSLRESEGARDKGGTPGKRSTDDLPRCTIGAQWTDGGQLRLQHVFRNGPAARAGLAAGDAIVAIDGLRASGDALESLLTDHAPGDVIPVHAFRRDELMTFDVTLASAPRDTAWLALAQDADLATRVRRKAWLGE
jgi:predicted metalloprotease with PDZ domain